MRIYKRLYRKSTDEVHCATSGRDAERTFRISTLFLFCALFKLALIIIWFNYY